MLRVQADDAALPVLLGLGQFAADHSPDQAYDIVSHLPQIRHTGLVTSRAIQGIMLRRPVSRMGNVSTENLYFKT